MAAIHVCREARPREAQAIDVGNQEFFLDNCRNRRRSLILRETERDTGHTRACTRERANDENIFDSREFRVAGSTPPCSSSYFSQLPWATAWALVRRA